MKQPRFEIRDSKDGQYYFVLIAPNGKVIATGETYKSKQGCEKGIKAVKMYSNLAKLEV